MPFHQTPRPSPTESGKQRNLARIVAEPVLLYRRTVLAWEDEEHECHETGGDQPQSELSVQLVALSDTFARWSE